MSVVTRYESKAYDSKNQPINLRDELIAKGVLTIIDVEKGIGKLNYDAACHDEWQKELAEMTQRGVVDFGNPYNRLNADGTIKETEAARYLTRFKPEPSYFDYEDGRKAYAYSVKDGIVSEISRDKDFNVDSIQYKALSKDESEILIKEATDFIKSYKKEDDGTYVRPYTEREIEMMTNPTVSFSKDGQTMSWYRNYNAFDQNPQFYASKAVSEATFENTSYTEGKLTGHFYSKNGELSTPTGKPCETSLTVAKTVVHKRADSKYSTVCLGIGDAMERGMIYMNNDNIKDSPREGYFEIYFEEGKNCTVYNLDSKTKSTMTPVELITKNQQAKEAFKLFKRAEIDKTMKQNKDFQVDSIEKDDEGLMKIPDEPEAP